MKNYKNLTEKQKAKLLDKLIYQAENIESNIFATLFPNLKLVKEGISHSKYFLEVVATELRSKDEI